MKNITWQQLECFVMVVKCDFHISRASEKLFVSQPAVTKQLQLLQEQVGKDLFIRQKKMIKGLSEAGEELWQHSSVLHENWNHLAQRLEYLGERHQGKIRIATTHTQAAYKLPKPLLAFKKEFPEVSIEIQQGSPVESVQRVLDGQADLAIATEEISQHPELLIIPCYRWNRIFLVPEGHPLIKAKKVNLSDVAKFPLLTYTFGFTARGVIDGAFASAKLNPIVALTALDAEVIKIYVRQGFGVGVLAQMAYEPKRDKGLVAIDASHCFSESIVWIGISRSKILSHPIKSFIKSFCDSYSSEEIDAFLRGEQMDKESLNSNIKKLGKIICP